MVDFLQGDKFKLLANNKNIYFCNTHDVNKFFDSINFTHKFILISHNSDGKVTDKPGPTNMGLFPINGKSADADVKKIPKNLIKWYAQNVNYVSPLIESIPIGLENSYVLPHLQKINKLFNITNKKKNFINLIYLNFNTENNPNTRNYIYKICKNKNYITSHIGKNGLNYEHYLNNLYNHHFMICPEGNGIDEHRTWESLYLGVIPIQVKNINNSNWRDLPICFIDSWDELTNEEYFIKEYHRITNTKFNMDKLNMNYWNNKILNSI
jgi:hypothetical protein